MKILMPSEVTYIIDTLYEKGEEAFAVGGAIRDALLGKEPNDWDITTSAKPDRVKEIFKEKNIKIIETGIKHGTVTLIVNGGFYEVTTYREEGNYENNRRPKEVFYTKSLKEDLKRRDFTINAFAYNDREGLLDYYKGKEDLKNGIIKAIGDPRERFEEDALRILRALRFCGKLNFIIEDETKRAIGDKKGLLLNISKERINEEFNKGISSKNALRFLENLLCLGVLPYVIEGDYEYYNDFYNFAYIEKFKLPLEIKVAMFFFDLLNLEEIDKCKLEIVKDNLNSLKYSNKEKKRIYDILERRIDFLHIKDKVSLKIFLKNFGEKNLQDLILFNLYTKEKDRVFEIEALYKQIKINNEAYKLKDLNLTGKDLISLGISHGKTIGEILNYLLYKVIYDEKLNNKEDLEKLSKEFLKSLNS